MKKICLRTLVTGGAGFVGSHLCRRLLSEGREVVCLDNLFTGDKNNIADLIGIPKFEFIEHDVIDPINLTVDEIYNLACPASPVHYQYDPIFTLKTSIYGALNMLELADRVGARILQASTSEIYGDPEVHPQAESYWGRVNPIGVRSCYDEGKRGAETLFFDYARRYKTVIRVVRIFNTYGPYMHPKDGRVVSNFIMQALTDQDITIYGDGLQTRSFQYVDDLIDGMVRMMNNERDFIGPVNLGNPGEFTIKELADIVLELIPESKSKVVFERLPSDDPKQRRPDISVANENLSWQPRIALEEGLLKTIEYFSKTVTKISNF